MCLKNSGKFKVVLIQVAKAYTKVDEKLFLVNLHKKRNKGAGNEI